MDDRCKLRAAPFNALKAAPRCENRSTQLQALNLPYSLKGLLQARDLLLVGLGTATSATRHLPYLRCVKLSKMPLNRWDPSPV